VAEQPWLGKGRPVPFSLQLLGATGCRTLIWRVTEPSGVPKKKLLIALSLFEPRADVKASFVG